MKDVSIIIPIYNVEKYVAECLNSVISQTYDHSKIECIIVDDCTPDLSMVIVDEIIGKYNGEIVFNIIRHEHNQGLSAARNTGIEAATGDYLYFIDSDDYIYPKSLELLLNASKEYNKPDVVVGNYYDEFLKNDYIQINKITELKNINLMFIGKTTKLTSWNMLIRRTVFSETGLRFSVVRYFEDIIINYQLYSFIKKAILIPECTYYYRDNLNTDVLYYISDKLSRNYDNHEGDSAQRNNAHFVEMVAALSIVDFCENNVQHDGSKSFKEFGFNEDKPVVSIKTLADSTRALIEKPLISMFIFEKFYKEHLKKTWDNAWAKDFSYADDDNEGKMDSTVMSHDFFVKLTKFLKDFDNEWLREMANNSRAFKPFNLETSGENIFNSIDGYEPKKTGFWGKLTSKNLEGYEAIDNAIADISNDLHKKLPMYDYFMDVHWQAINEVLKSKFGI